MEFRFVHISPLGDATGEDSEFQGIPAKRIGVYCELASGSRSYFPIYFFAGVIHWHGLNGRVFRRSQAEIKGEAIKSFQALGIELD